MSGCCCLASASFILILAALGSSEAGSPAAPTVETQSISQQNTEDTSDNAVSLPEKSTSEPPTSAQDSGQTEKVPPLVFRLENITISGFSETPVTKTITLEKPTELELLCSLVIKSSTEMEKMEVFWKLGNTSIKEESLNRTETHTKWCTRYTVKVEKKDRMKNYTCIFKTKPEIKATFHLQVPEIHIKSKNIVSYVGDYVVLTCTVGNEAVHYSPSSWAWKTTNGSDELITINTTVMAKKYDIAQNYVNITKLKIISLSERDSGSYWCEAVFPLGESKGEVSLTVLTYMAPLKPFLAVTAEVILLVAAIFIYEICTKRKEAQTVEVEKECEQAETLKSEDSNGLENSTTRQRKA